MCFKLYVFVVSLLFLYCDALNCRSDGGPKEDELRTIYMNCLKKQDGRNSSDSRRYSSDQDWNDARGYGQREWDRDSRSSNDKNRGDRMGSRSDRFGSGNDRMGSRDDRMNNRDGRIGNRDDRIGSNDRSSNRNERFGSRDNDMYGRDDRMDNYGMGARNRMGYQDEEIDRYRLNGRDDFSNDDYGSDMPRDSFYSSTQTPRRFRRDKRKEINSGHRSQYNPNAQKPTEYDDNYRNDDRNTSKNSSRDEEAKACALHCFLENLEMIGDSGMPDKYLVTHVLTKDVKNEDLRDFLQESIEECFQILENENTEDKCDFAKNLMMCLSEKGRSNCDDWKDDLKF